MEPQTYQLRNTQGVEIEFIPQGGKITAIHLPVHGTTDIVAGYDHPLDYLTQDEYIGALCGRFANRIQNGSVVIDGKKYQLSQNMFPNHLHGGFSGFHKKPWIVKPLHKKPFPSYVLEYLSPDGDEGYPGNLKAKVTYTLTDNNEFIIDFQATTDKPTIVNLTSHSYFNLNGSTGGDILNHELIINADRYTPLDDAFVTTGEILPVENTPLDFRKPVRLSKVVHSTFPQIKRSGGLDLNWVINRYGNELTPAAVLHSAQTGITLTLFTTQPGLQVYTAQHFSGTGKRGIPLRPFSGIALEAQNLPDAPNKPHFPPPFLYPGEIYHQKIVYRFSY